MGFGDIPEHVEGYVKPDDGRDPEYDDGRGVVTWKGVRIYYNRDEPDESGEWECDGLPQALWELLMDEHEDEILLAIYDEERA